MSHLKCSPNAALQERKDWFDYCKLKVMLTFTVTLLLEIGRKGVDFKEDTLCWMLKLGLHLIRFIFWKSKLKAKDVVETMYIRFQ